MRKIVTGCLGIWLGLLSWCGGAVGQYVELKSGICIPQEKQGVHYKKAPCFSVEYGLSWSAWRLGFQLGYVKYENKDISGGEQLHDTVFGYHEYKDKKFTAIACMANLYYNWHWCNNLDLYIGCGLGMARLNYRFCDNGENLGGGGNKIYNQDKYLLAAQLMCGMSYALNDHWSVSLGYRCMKMEKVKYNWIDNERCWPSLKTPLLHSLEVGLRYSF